VSAVCGGSSEPFVLTAWSVGFAISSVAQVDISLEKKATQQQVLPYVGAATSVAKLVGVFRENKILTLTPEKERFQDLAAKRKPNSTTNPKPRNRVTICV
jgi:hypothetical protein